MGRQGAGVNCRQSMKPSGVHLVQHDFNRDARACDAAAITLEAAAVALQAFVTGLDDAAGRRDEASPAFEVLTEAKAAVEAMVQRVAAAYERITGRVHPLIVPF